MLSSARLTIGISFKGFTGNSQCRIAVLPQAPAEVFRSAPLAPMTPERSKRVLYVGQTAFVKAPNVVASVFSRLSQEQPQLSLTWCTDRRHHDDIRQLLSRDARQHVRLVDWMPQSDLVSLYDQHGIFLFPSFYEGFGKAFLEAMARGLCVIASSTGGMRDIIQDGKSGFSGRYWRC